MLKRNGCAHIKALVLVAAPGDRGDAGGPSRCADHRRQRPATSTRSGYIIPGLGDAGDKIFGTKHG